MGVHFGRNYANKLRELQTNTERNEIGFLSLFKALEEYKQEDEYVAKISWVITLLLIIFELTPILIKSILPMGNYDERIGYLVLKGRLKMRFGLEQFMNKNPISGVLIPQNTIYDNHISGETINNYMSNNTNEVENTTSKAGNSKSNLSGNKISDWIKKYSENIQSKIVDLAINATFAVAVAMLMSLIWQKPFPEIGAIATFLAQSYLIANDKNQA